MKGRLIDMPIWLWVIIVLIVFILVIFVYPIFVKFQSFIKQLFSV